MPSKKRVEEPQTRPFPLLTVWVIAGLVMVAAFLSMGKWRAPRAPQPPAQPSLEERIPETLEQKVARHIRVDQDEAPTIATVQDPESLRKENPDFYRHASVGDRLLIWSDMAVLYSEKDDIILGVLPVGAVGEQAQENEVSPESTTSSEPELRQGIDTISVEVRNGTRTPGVAKSVSDALNEQGWVTLRPRDANTKGYEKTLVAIVTQNASTTALAPLLATDIGAEIVDNVPESEYGITGDILVIVGTDYPQSTE